MAGESYMGPSEAKEWETNFAEFTAKLITDTFDALVAANIRQTEAYIELVSKISKSLTEFINETKDDISGEMILQFLGAVLKSDPSEKVKVGGTLTKEEAKAINDATKVPEANPDGAKLPEDSSVTLTESQYKSILDAVAKRIAADKYTMLKEMVKMGVLRLVVEHGIIETRLTLNTYKSSYYASNATRYHSDNFNFRASAKTGGYLSLWVKASASTSYSSINVSTASQTNRDISGSQVQIYGYVRIDFKTDYQPMSTP